MEAHVITIKGNEVSETAAANCIASSAKFDNKFKIKTFEATTPDDVEEWVNAYKLQWNWPWDGEIHDMASGLRKVAYQTANRHARVACSMSHFRLWDRCSRNKAPMLIFEHDAIFTANLNVDNYLNKGYNIIGVNSPLGATRKSQQFHDIIQNRKEVVQPVPQIDGFAVPQGIAGNSAYILTPDGADDLLRACYQYGLWPNDAIMCRQIIKNIGVTKKYYTTIQRTRSTTTL